VPKAAKPAPSDPASPSGDGKGANKDQSKPDVGKGETGKGEVGKAQAGKGPAGKGPAGAPVDPAQPKGLAVQTPRTPLEREKALANLYALLATAADENQAKSISESIEKLWTTSGNDTVAVLMDRAQAAIVAKKPELAIKFLNSVVDLAPAYTEGWNRRAYVHFTQKDVERSLGDLRRVLALDPHHFRALDGLVQILRDIGQKKPALKAARQLLEVHPHWDGIKKTVEELAREVEGQGI
jgi:tetratricopeptide (TPR) repeat protein